MPNILTVGIADAANTIFTSDDVTATEDTVKGASAVIYAIEIDNTLNTAANYFKAFNTAGAVTVGTTIPDMILLAPAGTKKTYVFKRGLTFGTGLKIACVTTPGTAGTTAPTNNVAVQVAYS